jgi:PAS domain-containing protein
MGNKPKKLALRVVVIYAIVGFLWIIVSQKLAAGLVNGKRLLLQIDMYADWAFVSITAILSFFLLKRDYELLEKNTRQRVAAENEALKSENRYRKLFSVRKDAIFVVDQETGRFLDANPAAEKMYGYSHEEFLNLGPVGLSTDPEATKLLLEQEEEYISNRLHRRKDGTVFHV